MIYEDVDLRFRAQLRGYECVCIPQAIVYHRYRATIKKEPSRQVFCSQRNIDFVYLKNVPFGLILRSAPQTLLYEIGSAIYFVRAGTGGAFLKAKRMCSRICRRFCGSEEKFNSAGQCLTR
jgi:GT2 family glycosyltransferase